MKRWRDNKKDVVKSQDQPAKIQNPNEGYYAAIDLGTNSCRLVIAEPTPSSFHVVETFSKITRLGEGLINENMLSKPAIRRTVAALKICRGVLEEYSPIVRMRFVATAACRRALNCADFEKAGAKETGLSLEVISSREEAKQYMHLRLHFFVMLRYRPFK